MRALLILSVVVLSFFLLKWWSPGTSEAAPLEPIPESEPAQARFLAPPPSAQSPVTETTATSPSPEPVQQEQERRSDWPEPEAGGEQSELAAAAALVHGTPADVQVASAGLAPDRARLVEAFAWMLAGERQLAVSLSTKISKDEVPGREGALFEAALTGKAAEPASSMEGPLARAMEMALLSREAGESLRAGEPAEAARQYSRLLVGELEAPWTADPGVLAAWTLGLDEAQRHHRWDPRGEWPGVEMEVQPGDSMITVRKRFLADHPGAVLCTGLIERANDVKGFLQPGQKLRVPTDTARILVDLEARWALFFLGDEVAGSWPVGIGRPGEETPPGDYVAKDKIENPPWMKVGQEAIPFGDPRNPLGTRWIGWSRDGQKTSYGFHGTQAPESIGKAESDGCVRFRNDDIEELFQILPEGAAIRVQG